jgi:hypothetical protein
VFKKKDKFFSFLQPVAKRSISEGQLGIGAQRIVVLVVASIPKKKIFFGS